MMSKGKPSMVDFQAISITPGSIRLDWWSDYAGGPTPGRVTETVDITEAMAIVIVMIEAIERAETAEARAKKEKKK